MNTVTQSASSYDGSTAHWDPAREEFCQLLIAGEELYAAYEKAGFKRPHGNANRTRREEEVSRRLGYLAQRMAQFEESMLAYRRHEHRVALEHIATADRLALFDDKTVSIAAGVDAKGKPRRRRIRRLDVKPFSKLTPEQRALIDGFKISEKGAIEVLMPKRLDARLMLAKLDGFDRPLRQELTGKDGAPLVPEMTDDQLARALADFMAKTGQSAPPA